MGEVIYADNAATTRVSETAMAALMGHMADEYGNPSSIYAMGRRAKRHLETARVQVAETIGARPDEIYFTSGGTESDSWAIASALRPWTSGRRHVITSAVEHHAVASALEAYEKAGWSVTRLPVDEYGQVSLNDLKSAIRDDTALISIMTANNEIGTILPVSEIGAAAAASGVPFHTDAVQAVGHIPVDVREMGCDYLSLSGHKFHGPKGVGALYVRKGTRLSAFLRGGGQERGLRPGTENVPGICAMAAALTEAKANMKADARKTAALRDRLIERVLKIPGSQLTGHPENRLPGIASFVFQCVEGEALILMLDRAGICASSGSACSSGSLDPSHVLEATGLSYALAKSALRLSLSAMNTREEIDRIAAALPEIIAKLRATSSLWEENQHAHK